MTAKYALSIEHADVRRLFLEQETENKGIEAFHIQLRDDVPVVWNSAPTGKVKAHKVDFHGTEGFIFMNPSDNYCRYDFYTEDYLQSPPELVGIETPETTRIANEMAREQEKKEASEARQAKTQDHLRKLNEKLLRIRYDDCLTVNRKFGPVYDLPPFDEYLEAFKGKYVSSFSTNPFLEAVEEFEEKYGKTPELIVPIDANTATKVSALKEQLQREEFLHANHFHLKVQDLGKHASISVLDRNENLISFMKAPWDKRALDLEFYTGIDFEAIESHQVNCYSIDLSEASHVELGKKVDYDDLKFPELYDAIADLEFADMRGEEVEFEHLADTDSSILEMSEFTGKAMMEHLMAHQDVLIKVKGVISSTSVPAYEKPVPEDTLGL